MTNSTGLFSGWLGIGSAYSAGVLGEPTDASYVRRPIQFGPVNGSQVTDLFPGTIGPAAANWGVLSYAGLFDAQSAGDLLAIWPLSRPVQIGAGQTWTTGAAFGFTLALDPGASLASPRVWVAGSMLGTTRNGQPITACQNLQVSNGQLLSIGGAVATTTNAPLTGASLPTVSPTVGSGQLWNNGGVICVA